MMPGENASPMHPHCRCAAAAHSDRKEYDEWLDFLANGGTTEEWNRLKNAKVDKPVKSGIIAVGSGGMFRKSQDGKVDPMPKKQFHRIEKAFKKSGGIFQYDDVTDEYLRSKNAEAITYDSKTILFKQNPSRASVFEELIHCTQYKNGENDGTYLCRLKCEIEAQKKLIKYAKNYKLTDFEVKQTEVALGVYENELLNYLEAGGAE